MISAGLSLIVENIPNVKSTSVSSSVSLLSPHWMWARIV